MLLVTKEIQNKPLVRCILNTQYQLYIFKQLIYFFIFLTGSFTYFIEKSKKSCELCKIAIDIFKKKKKATSFFIRILDIKYCCWNN